MDDTDQKQQGEREPLVGYVVIDEHADDMSHWDGAIAYPNPEGANLFWEKPEPFIQKSAYDKLAAENAELRTEIENCRKFVDAECVRCDENEKQNAELKAENERLKKEIKILTNPSDGRCMEISNLRDYRDKLRTELIAARKVFHLLLASDRLMNAMSKDQARGVMDCFNSIDKLLEEK